MRNDPVAEKIEVAMAAGGKAAAYAGGASAFFGGLSANEVAAIGGLVVAAIGLVVQIIFNRKRDRREAEYHAARMTELKTVHRIVDDE